MQAPIPFEIHLTVAPMAPDAVAAFAATCARLGLRPLWIELGRGDTPVQPMGTTVIAAHTLAEVRPQADALARKLQAAGHAVTRTKVEVPATEAVQVAQHPHSYFEWHGRVTLHNAEALAQVCAAHGAHLSRNGLHQDPSRRFVTLRVQASYGQFHAQVQRLRAALEQGGWPVQKATAEYCVFDSNISLDHGWLSTPAHE